MFDTSQLIALDTVTLNFSPAGIIALNITLAFIMFGVALDIQKVHIRQIIQTPKLIIIGLVAQYVFLPLVTLALVWVLTLPVSISIGMLLVASCPGGNISNYITALAKGNVALSVSLTAASDFLSIILTPIIFTGLANWYLGKLPLTHPIHIPLSETFKTIFLLTALPIAAGLWFKHKWPSIAQGILTPIKRLSFVLFIGFVIGAISLNFEHFSQHVWLLIPVVALHNALAFLTGYITALIAKVDETIRKTITIETGIQNSGIALALIFNHQIFPEGFGGAAFIAALWGIWHIISGLILGSWWASSDYVLNRDKNPSLHIIPPKK